MRFLNGEKALAIVEAAKGLLVLVAGFDLVSHRHYGLRRAVLELVRNFHLDPASRHPRIFALLSKVSNEQLWTLAVLAAAYALMRFVEAYGLWRSRRWAEWFAVISAATYLPIEIYGLYRKPHWPVLVLFSVNLFIVLYLGHKVWRNGSREGKGL